MFLFFSLQVPDLPLDDIIIVSKTYFDHVISDEKSKSGASSSSILKWIAFNELSVTAATLVNKFPNKGNASDITVHYFLISYFDLLTIIGSNYLVLEDYTVFGICKHALSNDYVDNYHSK